MARPLFRSDGERFPYQLHSRFFSANSHEMTMLLRESYSKVGIFPHMYHIDGAICASNPSNPSYLEMEVGQGQGEEGRRRNSLYEILKRDYTRKKIQERKGVSAVDFDKEGKYLASVTNSGCITVQDFEVLYTQTQSLPSLDVLFDDERKHVLHLSMEDEIKLDAVKWNPLDQNQVACASEVSNELLLYDVQHAQLQPSVYRTTLEEDDESSGLSDVAFATNDPLIFASDIIGGSVYAWDSRIGTQPCWVMRSQDRLNSIQLDVENQVIFAAGRAGAVYASDIRGGRDAINNTSLLEMWSTSILQNLEAMKNASGPRFRRNPQIISIRLNPSSPNQLAFYLRCGWSGVLDVHNNFNLTHINTRGSPDRIYIAKPSWLSTYSIFLTPYKEGLLFLDFHPSRTSPWHVHSEVDQRDENVQLPLSKGIISCASHPRYTAIVAGADDTSLVMISQRRQALGGDD